MRWALSVGGRLVIDGETITVHSVNGAEVRGHTERGEPARFILTRVEHELAEACNEEWQFGSGAGGGGCAERRAVTRGS